MSRTNCKQLVREGLGEGYDRDVAFASSLEMFGGGHSDPISVAFGGPVMTKFTIALREIGTYTEVLRSQPQGARAHLGI
ncbi:ADP-ribosylation factor GTPase-activating protein [Musa troglodytarum]|uniref:ADP-ribosylation factor GTPase-activating protein n=1 Tax=Musa troglodytarum TaxID=320322 RepID=A0A9E7GTI9_9LILI|nr:ADP-ribosylation factor GTPase-activating protein [Musa troglodytarum]